MSRPTPGSITLGDLLATLAAGRIAHMSLEAWTPLAGSFPEIERHPTGVAGDLVIVRTPDALAAVETPPDRGNAVRPLANPDAVRRFVVDRLAQYERMWEGCGGRVSYDS